MGLAGNPEYGGMGMLKMLSVQFEEMVYAANASFALYLTLSAGACLALDAHASEELKQKYLPAMYEGRWAGSMCLTEPHAGTDLRLIRTKAEPQADGSYAISGTKIFITGGEQDLTENIIHLVLAKLPDAPAGSRGISLFLVPKVLVGDDGALCARNAVSCGSIEHKMGIKASATCVMNFDGAIGWLVGEPNKGLVALLTPVAKAFFTDTGLESCVHGQQVFGGHGYIREWGQEQLVRDVRIAQIYEGTNGIQALDLVGRKVLANGGELLALFAGEIRAGRRIQRPAVGRPGPAGSSDPATAGPRKARPTRIGRSGGRLPAPVRLHRLRLHVGPHGPRRRRPGQRLPPGQAGARSCFARLLPRTQSLASAVRAGSESLYALEAEQF